MARQRSIFEDMLAGASPTDIREREAALLLKNLLARLDADAATDRPQFRGVVSDAEREALRELLGGVGPCRSSPPAPPVEPVVEPEPTQPTGTAEPPEEGVAETTLPAVELNLDALRPDVSPPPQWVLCLDFGTAKSKAFAATDDEEDPELEPLPIGEDDDDLDGSVYEVSSCVWIDDDGRLFVGSEAVKRGMNYGGDSRAPLDSLKQEISQVDQVDGLADLQGRLPKDVDPTSTLTYADVITIYLAYLTDLATTAIARRVGTRYVLRRFTVPCWQSTQRGWAAELLGKSLLRAQLLADTFRDRWRDGIPVEQVAHAVRAAAAHDGELTRLATTESDDVTHWSRGSLEALGAASARVWRDRFARDLMLVVDVGAGTTDLSLFWVVQDGESHRAFPIVNGNSGIREAGDTIDRLLVEALLRKAGLGVDETGKRARRGLRRKGVRRMKERLFQVGSLTETLVNDQEVTLSREEFVQSEEVRSFEERVADTIKRLLGSVHESWGRAASEKGITLVLTGGGCDLPMITALKDRPWRLHERAISFRVARRVPRSVEDRFDAPFIQVYPRLAVAMGGALTTRLDERNALLEWMGGELRPGRLESFATKGV
jgi:molecular chaperone HscA